MAWFKNFKVRGKLLVSFMLVLVIFIGVSVFTISELKNIDRSYTEAIGLTEERFGHIFNATEHFTSAQKALLEIYNPENTAVQLSDLSGTMDNELNAVRDGLLGLRDIAAAGTQEKIDEILPLLEEYRAGSEALIGSLSSAGDIDLNNPVYRSAMESAQEESKRLSGEYGDVLSASLADIPTMALAVLKSLGDTNGLRADNAMIISIVILVIMALIIVTIAMYISSLISKPLILLSTFMKRAGSTGDIALSQTDAEKLRNLAKVKDEIGEAINGSAAFVEHVTYISGELKSIADGDLTHDVTLLSGDDVMGKSLKQMTDNLNSMFSDINSSTSQVLAGSRQVASGAQALAQGTTEQAASIEQLSSTIAEIAERTRENVATTVKTKQLSGNIIENAEKGSRQMGVMTTAVSEINEASKSIGKIIKTIDDIAFQTNILALNAAVEAARAGQHGKGFAVVAEEVRNLASKSAEAAKDTGGMIQNSIEKAGNGVLIAVETAESLKEIVNGISESYQLVEEISKASEEQSLAISQVNVGIDQVAQVVQQNSATAEESAAASEEMSGQSDMLRQLVAEFRLKDIGVWDQSFSPSDIPPDMRLGAAKKSVYLSR